MASARLTVAKLLIRMEESSYSNILLDKELSHSDLSPEDKRFVSRLFYGVIERRITLDYVLSNYLTKPLLKLDIEVLTALRMGIYQLLYTSVPDNAAVNESVNITKKLRRTSASAMVNAILRSFIRDGKKLALPTDRVKALSVEYSSPEWLAEKWISEYGEENAVDMLKSSVNDSSFTLRINNTKTTTAEVLDELQKLKIDGKCVDFIKNCIKVDNFTDITSSELYKKGLFHVQDTASQLCCMALSPDENDTVLDVCSAPGGKSFTIAEMMNGKGKVYAYDLHENRVKLISDGAKRLGLDNITVGVADASAYNPEIPEADKILCDVVCAGLGVIGKKPEIKYKNQEDLKNLPEIQYKILCNSSKYLKVGGELVYSTCSVSREENDGVIDRFLAEHDDFEGVEFLAPLGEPFGSYKATLFPRFFGSDGFFISKVRRIK